MPTETKRNFATRLPMNVATNIFNIQTNVVIGIFLELYLLSIHRVAANGFIPIMTLIKECIAIIVPSLNTAISRYLTIHIRRENNTVANSSFSKVIYITFCQWSKKCVSSHFHDLKVMMGDTEIGINPIAILQPVNRIYSSGVA